MFDLRDVFIAVFTQISTFRDESSDSPNGVLDTTLLPRTVWIAEEHFHIESTRDMFMVAILDAVVPGDRLAVQVLSHACESTRMSRRLHVRCFLQTREPRLALVENGERLCAPRLPPGDDGIRLKVAEP